MPDAGATGAAALLGELRAQADAGRARQAQRYFRTAPGQYGAGDRFLGIRVPLLRRLARRYRGLPLDEVSALLCSEYHEARLVGLFLLVDAYARGGPDLRERIVSLYLEHTRFVNNWDLVDASAPGILGMHLLDRDSSLLDRLAASELLWERRMAVLATFPFIRQGRCAEALRLAEALLDDGHDLIHKAVGWMLREVGKHDPAAARRFLDAHCRQMPRTMLRYAIEKLPPDRRAAYLRGEP